MKRSGGYDCIDVWTSIWFVDHIQIQKQILVIIGDYHTKVAALMLVSDV